MRTVDNIKSRRSGVELLRIISILMVISVHRMGHQTLYSAPQFSINYYILWFIEIASYKAVDIFFIISGYFGVVNHFKVKKFLTLELKVMLYCVGFYLLSVVMNYQIFDLRVLLRSFLPYLGEHYWYYTAYISLMLLSPWLNKFIICIDKKKYLLLILVVSGISTISIGDAFFTADGYSVFWAINLYFIGGYIRLHCHKLIPPKISFLMSFACTMFIFLWFVIVGKITYIYLGRELFSTHFLVYRQFPVLLGAVFSVITFVQINFNGLFKKIVNFIAKYTFGVYIIHSCVFMDTLFWVKLFPASTVCEKNWYWIYVIVSILLMYIVCIVIEIIRNMIFAPVEKSRVFNRLLTKIEVFLRLCVKKIEYLGEYKL